MNLVNEKETANYHRYDCRSVGTSRSARADLCNCDKLRENDCWATESRPYRELASAVMREAVNHRRDIAARRFLHDVAYRDIRQFWLGVLGMSDAYIDGLKTKQIRRDESALQKRFLEAEIAATVSRITGLSPS